MIHHLQIQNLSLYLIHIEDFFLKMRNSFFPQIMEYLVSLI